MVDFNKQTPTFSTEELTVELGTDIYNLIKEKGSVQEAIKASQFDPDNIMKIEKEIERIISIKDRKVVVTPAEYDEDGNITTEEVKDYVELTSDIIDVDVVLVDFPRTVLEE